MPDAPAEAIRIVDAMKDVWRLSASMQAPRTLEKAGVVAARIIETIAWFPKDAPWLEDMARDLSRYPDLSRESGRIAAVAAIQRDRAPARVALRWSGYLGAGFLTLWTIVLLLYPWAEAARWMIWTRWARRLSGLGLPLTLLLRLPAYHFRLWKPFRESLLPPAELQTFDEWSFFDSIRMAPLSPVAGGALPALQVLRNLSGVWVLQGASGLGKTTLLQCLAAESPTPAAFVRASTCQDGIVETLRRRLPRHAQGDAAFLRKLIRSGSLLVMIDAVHEAAIPVQERLVREVESLRGGKF
ncbi:MAG TPA: hypothetical protein VHM91_03675, partial [Verrucomicrobiales bacterium]|nr:hypothetical protein [Verrucomicrobiales bacterium]